MSKEVQIIGYADDIAVTIGAKELHLIERIRSTVALRNKEWLTTAKLQLAGQNTEAVLISSRKKVVSITLNIDRHSITSQSYLKYLGVIIDARIN